MFRADGAGADATSARDGRIPIEDELAKLGSPSQTGIEYARAVVQYESSATIIPSAFLVGPISTSTLEFSLPPLT